MAHWAGGYRGCARRGGASTGALHQTKNEGTRTISEGRTASSSLWSAALEVVVEIIQQVFLEMEVKVVVELVVMMLLE